MLKKILVVSLILVSIAGFTACQKGTIKDKQSQSLEPIKVGLIYPLTGQVAFGDTFRDGVILASETINDSGGIHGRKIDLIVEDSQSDGKIAMNAFNKLTNISGVDYIMTTLSRVGMNLKPLAEKQGRLMFMDVAHPDAVKDSQYILRHSQNLEQEVEIMTGYIVENNYSKVGIIAMNDDFGLGFLDKLESQLKKIGGVNFFPEITNSDETNFHSITTKLVQNDVQIVIIGGGGKNYSLAVKQLREFGYRGDIFGPVGISLVSGTIEAMGNAKKGMYYITFDVDKIINTEFKRRFEERFGKEPEVYSVTAYTNIELLAFAIENVGEDPLHIVNFIKNLKEFKGTRETVKIDSEGNIYPPLVVKQFE